MKNFQGEMSSQSLVDILQFYIQNQSCVSIKVNHSAVTGEIWISDGRILHATTKSNYGIDAFYEMLSWEDGHFKVNLNRKPDDESIQKPWTELILEYYVLVDEGMAKKSTPINKSNAKLISFDYWNQIPKWEIPQLISLKRVFGHPFQSGLLSIYLPLSTPPPKFIA